ncbi:hypothetical protein [Bizionia myxarmorum]|uniref:Uncharacterized protein n=1 Tax=Bizionia myxarmorum TaxID=291186 RepID=A0A5D0QVK8_9FLAO|nr:hypothetical protein [Bizionia myxarmorum]TYB73200.1 hypothetical protein ES674_15250 [Bizionia myxarmorum]
MKLSRLAFFILILGITLILLAPLIFTQYGIVSFTNTGQIGDTIGGITAPITGIIGAILVYLALKAQINANEIIQGQITEQKADERTKRKLSYISDLYKYFLQAIDNFEYTKSNGNGGIIKILAELSKMERKIAHDDSIFDKGKIAELNAIFRLENMFIKQVNKADIEIEDKEYFRELIHFHLESFVLPHVSFESVAAPCSVCGEKHNGIPFKLIELINNIQSNLG